MALDQLVGVGIKGTINQLEGRKGDKRKVKIDDAGKRETCRSDINTQSRSKVDT